MCIDLQTNKIIVVNFPSFSGGKFIMNCLSLSKHSVPQNKKIAEYLLNNPEDYSYRLNAVISTLPPFEDMKNWRQKWEFTDSEFYNSGNAINLFNDWKQNKSVNDNTRIMLSKLISKNISFFLTSHGGINNVKKIIDLWPNCKIITLINSKKFWNIAIHLKQENAGTVNFVDYVGNDCQDKYQLLKGDQWPDWNLFEQCHYDIDKVAEYVTIKQEIKQEIKQFYQWHQIKNKKFCLDVDNSFFSKETFLKTINDLYNWLGFDDFNSTLVENYYQRYMLLHNITQQE
jgi:hypothetical protein